MASGIELTLRTLMRSPNPRATDLLVVALEGPPGPLRVGAARALALRYDIEGHRKLVEALAGLDPPSAEALADLPRDAPLRENLAEVIRLARPSVARRGSKLAVRLGVVEAIPAIIEAALTGPEELGAAFAEDALLLAERLERDMALHAASSPGGADRPADPAFARREALNALATALDRYGKRPLRDLLEALLTIAPPDEPAMRQALRDAAHPASEPLRAALRTGTRRGAIGVLAAILGDLRAPQELVELATQRADREGVELLLEAVGAPVGLRVRENCQRVESFAWLDPSRLEVLTRVSATAQAAAIQVRAASSASRRLVARAVSIVLESHDAAARLAACRAIESLPGVVAAEVLGQALAADDPAVVACAASMLRGKNVAGSTAILVGLLDHRDSAVRDKAGKSLRELSFAAYRDALDELPPDARPHVGRLVAKADPMTAPTLRAELGAAAVSRRLAALELIDLTGVADELADALSASLAVDRDAAVRVEAARLLGGVTPTPAVLDALSEVANARSAPVREAARASLERLAGMSFADLQGAAR